MRSHQRPPCKHIKLLRRSMPQTIWIRSPLGMRLNEGLLQAARLSVWESSLPPSNGREGLHVCLPHSWLISKSFSSGLLSSLYDLSQGSPHVFEITQVSKSVLERQSHPCRLGHTVKKHPRSKAQHPHQPILGTVVLRVFLHVEVPRHLPLPF